MLRCSAPANFGRSSFSRISARASLRASRRLFRPRRLAIPGGAPRPPSRPERAVTCSTDSTTQPTSVPDSADTGVLLLQLRNSRWPSNGRSATARPSESARAASCRSRSACVAGDERSPSPTRAATARTPRPRASGCSRRRPGSLALPSFTAVAEATVAGEVQFGVLPIESTLAGPIAETHDLLQAAPLSIASEIVAPRPPLPPRGRQVPLERDQGRPLASRRARPVPAAARGDAVGDARSPPGRRPRRPPRSPSAATRPRRRSRASGLPRSTA